MAFILNVTSFGPLYRGGSLMSSYSYATLEEATRAASQNACLSSSDTIEVIDEQGKVRVIWTSLYNFICRFEATETPDEYFTRMLDDHVRHIERFIPDFSKYLNGRRVSFTEDGTGHSFEVIPGTESFLMDACMDAACEAEDAHDDGKDDIPVMITAMNKYQQELERRQQRYEAHKQSQKEKLANLLL